MELVKDKATKEPANAELSKLAAFLRSRHMYVLARNNMLWVCPPLIITQAELDHGLDIIEEGLRKLAQGEI